MENNPYFAKALSDMTFDMAARGAIRHLADQGCTPEQIRAQLTYPVSLRRIETELAAYAEEKRSSENGAPQYTYVKETSPEGKVSFRRVPKQ